MEKKHAEVEPGPAARRGLEFDDWILANEEQLPESFEAIPLDYDLITGVLTRERIRLVNHLRDNGPVDSLQELAQALGRDKAAVSRDVTYLSGSLVQEEKKGRNRKIWATPKPIIIY